MTAGRPYRSKLREEQAEETRLRIRVSARRLFEAHGFAATTVAAIAEAAGVSTQTVYAVFGGKGGIVASMLEELEQSIGMGEWVARMVAEPDPRQQLRLFVAMNRTMFESGAPIIRAAVEGRGSPEVALIGERGDAARREGAHQLMGLIASKGALRAGLDAGQAAARLWLLTSAEQYLHAADKLGWSGEHYEQWLGDLLERELLAGGG